MELSPPTSYSRRASIVLFPRIPKSSSPERVVVTGAGVVTSLGIGWLANEAGFRAGRTAFRPVTLFDVSRQRAKTAAEIDVPAELPENSLSEKARSRLDRATRILLLAAHEAWARASLGSSENIPVVLGTTSGGMALGEAYSRQTLDRPKTNWRQATRLAHYQAQLQALELGQALGFKSQVTILANACASGANAIGYAFEMLRHGNADVVMAGGYDALCQLTFAGFDSLQALSCTTCRPFDARRDGLSLGEGAAVLILETLDHARKRNAGILGEIAGYGAVTDTHHLTQPHPEGAAAYLSMQKACDCARVTSAQIDYVNAHGTATIQNDATEALAINRWAGACAAKVSVSSSKGNVGHLLGGAGAVGALTCLMALRGQWLPPQAGLTEPEPLCQFQLVRSPTDARVTLAAANSFGFGGANATLILRRWP